MTMDESTYLRVAERTFQAIEHGLRDTDPDDVDCERAGDVLTLTFKGNRRCILNTQRPTRQLWLAANARAWHFSYDESKEQWFDDKRHEEELLSTVAGIVQTLGGIEVNLR
jgi:CyaY protein